LHRNAEQNAIKPILGVQLLTFLFVAIKSKEELFAISIKRAIICYLLEDYLREK